MWQADGGAKQSTRRGGPILLKTCKPSVSANSVWPIYTSSCIKLTTNSSNDKEEESFNLKAAYLTIERIRSITKSYLTRPNCNRHAYFHPIKLAVTIRPTPFPTKTALTVLRSCLLRLLLAGLLADLPISRIM